MVVGAADLLEQYFGARVSWVLVRVVAQRKSPVGVSDILLLGIWRDTEGFVEGPAGLCTHAVSVDHYGGEGW